MMTENLPVEAVDAPKPDAAPAIPPGFIDVTRIRERDLEYLDQASADQIRLAQAASREAKRAERAAADGKVKAESEASTTRANDAVDEIVQRDAETPEEDTAGPTEGYPIAVEATITGTERAAALEYAHDVGILAKEAGVPQPAAQSLFDLAADLTLTDTSGVDGSNPDAMRAVLSSRYGEEGARRLIEDSQAAVRKLGPSVREYLNLPLDAMGTCLGSHPAVIAALAHLHRGDLGLAPELARAEIMKLRQTKEYQQGQRATVDRVRLLSRLAARGEKNEVAVPVKKQPMTPSKVQQRIDAIRRDPNYYGGDNRLRAVLVAEMAELHRQLHGE